LGAGAGDRAGAPVCSTVTGNQFERPAAVRTRTWNVGGEFAGIGTVNVPYADRGGTGDIIPDVTIGGVAKLAGEVSVSCHSAAWIVEAASQLQRKVGTCEGAILICPDQLIPCCPSSFTCAWSAPVPASATPRPSPTRTDIPVARI
jgi:hypothetical protein